MAGHAVRRAENVSLMAAVFARWPILSESGRNALRCDLAGLRCDHAACKPGSVQGFHPWATIPLGRRLPAASSNQPG